MTTRPAARDAPLYVVGAALLVLPFFMTLRSGGYGIRSQLIGAIAAFVMVAVVALAARWPILPRGAALGAAAALCGYAVWTGISIGWAPIVDRAAQDTSRVAMYAAVFVAALAAMRLPALRRLVPELLLLGVTLACAYGLGGRFLPHTIHIVNNAGSRLSHPLTYWNSMGMFAGFGVVLGVAVAGDVRRALPLRAAACAAVVPCALACFLTLSRGALLATLAGVVVCVVLRPGRGGALAAACGIAATTALGLALIAFPALLKLDRGVHAQLREGRVYVPIAIIVTVATGLAFARLARSRSSQGELLPAGVRRVLAIVTIPLVLAVGTVVAGAGTEKTKLPTGASRITTVRTNRGHYWRVALETFSAHPFKGIGTAGFRFEWQRKRGNERGAVDAHSLYLETLAELGVVGALLMLAFLACLVRAVVMAVRAVPGDTVTVAGAAVLGALAIHVAVDWDWEMPAVILPALVLAAAAVQPPLATGPEPRLET